MCVFLRRRGVKLGVLNVESPVRVKAVTSDSVFFKELRGKKARHPLKSTVILMGSQVKLNE